MSPLKLLPALVLAVLLALAPAAHAQVAPSAPTAKTLYQDGPSGRFLLDGAWLFRQDPTEVGQRDGYPTSSSQEGWIPTTVPNAWNATDQSEASFVGTTSWYRRDFTLPSKAKALGWTLRFESVNYRMEAWLNGTPIGSHRGAYLPFELRLPPSKLKRGGVNRLVVRVNNVRSLSDFPPAGLAVTGKPTGGWWNYGGLLREVYLRRVDRVDLTQVTVRPVLGCRTCAATVQFRISARNPSEKAVRATIRGTFGDLKVDFGTVGIGAGQTAQLSKDVRIAQPRLWSPGRPALYDTDLAARVRGKVVQRYHTQTGIRSIKVADGRLLLNGQPVHLRGVGLHEDDPTLGFAITNQIRDRELAEVQEVGATIIRSHYPLSPYTMERADQLGLLIWSEIPVYSLRTSELAKASVRRLATEELQSNIQANGNHPSVAVWSVGNELSSKPGPVQSYYLANAARVAKELDPTRPVAVAIAGYPSAGCQPEYGPLDIIGINDYFGWYAGPNGQIADRTLLPEYLDQVRACYPKKAIVITETGAEANRDGPVEEKGTYAFQQDFVNYHFGVYATKPWLSGALYWALEEFRVRPGWDGGNPRPTPPIHQKGLISQAGARKPAFGDVQRIFRATKQIG